MPKDTWGVICFESWGVARFSRNISFSPQAKTKETSDTDFITHTMTLNWCGYSSPPTSTFAIYFTSGVSMLLPTLEPRILTKEFRQLCVMRKQA